MDQTAGILVSVALYGSAGSAAAFSGYAMIMTRRRSVMEPAFSTICAGVAAILALLSIVCALMLNRQL